MTRSVAIYLFDEVEVLDFAAPYEVFTTAARVLRRSEPQVPVPFEVFTVGAARGLVRARAGLQVLAERAFDEVAHADVLLIPGGVVERQLQHAALIEWIATRARSAEVTASVCTGAFLLARAGLLDGRSATTHWEDLDDLRARFPRVRVEGGRRWIDHGDVITSAGITAGLDMSLHLVARLGGRALAEATARQLEVDWRDTP
ncbi:MAG TPA: DJ-1/PfpI family protein [Lysobacter sp.]|nr:DJ-1/PfpI family protein [Lysobacter sp.]